MSEHLSLISPSLYKELKGRIIYLERKNSTLEERNKELEQVVQQQQDTINKLNRMIDVLCM